MIILKQRSEQLAPRDETERRKHLLPPVASWEPPRPPPNKCGSQEKQPFTDGYRALPPNPSNRQTIGQFCPFFWHKSILTMVRWASMCLSDWFLACHGFSHRTSHTLQCIDWNFCNDEIDKWWLKWSRKGSDDCSTFSCVRNPHWGFPWKGELYIVLQNSILSNVKSETCKTVL